MFIGGCGYKMSHKRSSFGILNEIKWKLVLYKYRILRTPYDIIDSHMRRRYCRHGFHKLRVGSLIVNDKRKKNLYVRYLRCEYCNYKFFANKKDKDTYVKYTNTVTGTSFSTLID